MNALFRPGGKVFYGWWIVAACAGIQWLAALTWMHSYGAYAVLLQEDFGWSMSVLSLAFALTRLESGLLGPFQGYLVDRFGPRRILTIGTLIFGLGFFAFSRVDSILAYFVAFVLIALGSSLGGFATLMVSVVNWFDRNRAKAVAWSQLGFSFGGLCVPLVIVGLETFGWQTMAAVSGVLVLAVGLPLARLIHHRPEEIGEVVDGIPEPAPHEQSEAVQRLVAKPSFTWQQAVRAPAFWLLSTGHGLSLFAVSSMLAHLIPHLTKSLGFSLATAGIAFSMMTGMQMLGLFLGGFLGDRYDKRIIVVFTMLGHCFGLLAITYAENFYWIIAFAVLHGLGWGTRGPMMVALRADYFGPRSFGTIMGISSLVVMVGMTAGPIVCGVLYDIHGDYEIAFTAMALAALLGSVCFWAARPPQLPQTETSPAATPSA